MAKFVKFENEYVNVDRISRFWLETATRKLAVELPEGVRRYRCTAGLFLADALSDDDMLRDEVEDLVELDFTANLVCALTAPSRWAQEAPSRQA